MLGGYDKAPDLYTIAGDGIAQKEETYASVGSGSAYADYILQRLYVEGMKLSEGLDCAAYTIEEVKKVDPSCGGPVQLITVDAKGVHSFTSDDTKSVVDRVTVRDDLLAEMWRALVFGRKSHADVRKFLGLPTRGRKAKQSQ